MLVLFWFLLFLIGTCLILLMPSLWAMNIFDRYRGKRAITCPETQAQARVSFAAWRAAISGLSGQPKLRLATCSRWPMRADCGQDCIPEATQVQPEGKPAKPESKRVAHLPVLLAAALAWLLGMAWHSQFAFRARWAAAIGWTSQQTHDLVWTWAPHLLTVAACLIFAYAIGCLLAWTQNRTLLRGVGISLAVWIVIAGLVAVGQSVSREVILIEGGYTFLAALTVGAIVGGAPRRLFLRESE